MAVVLFASFSWMQSLVKTHHCPYSAQHLNMCLNSLKREPSPYSAKCLSVSWVSSTSVSCRFSFEYKLFLIAVPVGPLVQGENLHNPTRSHGKLCPLWMRGHLQNLKPCEVMVLVTLIARDDWHQSLHPPEQDPALGIVMVLRTSIICFKMSPEVGRGLTSFLQSVAAHSWFP